MSISEKRTFTVRCNDCAREVIKESGTFVWSSADVRSWLKVQGWKLARSRHTCPLCVSVAEVSA